MRVVIGDTDKAAEMLGPEYHLAQQQDREQDGQGITTASRHPFGRIWVANHFPDYQLDHADPDWPFRGIGHVLIRCGSAGPSLPIRGCRRIFDHGQASASDHYGPVVEFGPS
jgi:hypothetical protein